jgi:hypothetical protein
MRLDQRLAVDHHDADFDADPLSRHTDNPLDEDHAFAGHPHRDGIAALWRRPSIGITVGEVDTAAVGRQHGNAFHANRQQDEPEKQ